MRAPASGAGSGACSRDSAATPERWHAMWAVVPNIWYRCRRCRYEGTLAEAVAHAVTNQETFR